MLSTPFIVDQSAKGLEQSPAPSKYLKTLASIGYMLLWGISFTFSMSLAKCISADVPSAVIVFLRCLFGLIVFLPFAAGALKTQGIRLLKVQQPLVYCIRVILVSLAMGCTYYAYRNLPIATASAIGFSSPLFTTLLGICFLKNRINLKQGLSILAGYGGVLVIIGPFSFALDSAETIAILANLLASCAIILLKKLSTTESNITILFYTNIATVLLSGMSALFMWHTPSWGDAGLLVLIGMSSTLSQLFYTQALRMAEPYFVAPFEYNRLLFALLSGYYFFDESPNPLVFIGAGFIIASNLYLSFLEIRQAKALG
jgi:drug/metabolite transporter (DMT)-like permease